MNICVYVCVVVEGMCICKTGNLALGICAYVCVVVEGMYICKTGYFENNSLCLCLCSSRSNVHMQD